MPPAAASEPAEDTDDDLEALLEAEFEEASAAAAAAVAPLPPAKRAKTSAPRAAGGPLPLSNDAPLDAHPPIDAAPPPPASDQPPAACPPHPGYMGGLCIRCGALRGAGGAPDPPGAAISLRYIHHGLEVSQGEAARLRAGTAQRALSARRLLLVLDLDHTLLNSARLTDVSPAHAAGLAAQLEAQPADAPLLYHLPRMSMWTRLRPGVREFLAAAARLFDLHVYTMGDYGYAAGMAELLDPGGRLFAGRVASSRDASGAGVKGLEVLLGGEELALVLDDTAAVWPRHRDNLVQIERYIYFPACAAKFGRGGTSLLERGEDEDPSRGALATSLRVLSDVHARFFAAAEAGGPADVRAHLAAARRAVLAGCVVLFTRIIPLDCPDPEAHPLWRLAVQFGARCCTVQGEEVTHVVAGAETDKTRWAARAGKHVVSASWLWCSAFTWERADEARFALGRVGDDVDGGAAPGSVSEEAELAAALAAAGGGQEPAEAGAEAAAPPL